jgi:hypothetical protein
MEHQSSKDLVTQDKPTEQVTEQPPEQSLDVSEQNYHLYDPSKFDEYCRKEYDSKANLRFIGQGVDGRCYVEEEKTVIKVYGGDWYGLRMLQNEAKCLQDLASLHPPSSIQEFVSCDESRLELRTKYVPGGETRTLDKLFNIYAGGTPASEAELQQIFEAILEVLAWLHSNKWLHYDCVGQNIIWKEDGTVQLIDFAKAGYDPIYYTEDLSYAAQTLTNAAFGRHDVTRMGGRNDLGERTMLPGHFSSRLNCYVEWMAFNALSRVYNNAEKLLTHWRAGLPPPE